MGHRSSDNIKLSAYPFHINGVSEDHALSCLSYHLGIYNKVSHSVYRGWKSTFRTNFSRALNSILTEGFYQSEVITLSGYVIDFEVLLGKDNGKVQFPHLLRQRSYLDGLRSIRAIAKEPGVSISHPSIKPLLINALKDYEESGKGGDSNLPEMSMAGVFYVVSYQLIFLWETTNYFFPCTCVGSDMNWYNLKAVNMFGIFS